jgi:hypothetical protein
MADKREIGIAPLIAGIVLAGQSLPLLLQTGPSLWTVSSVIGGVSAIFVGVGVLLERGIFETETVESNQGSNLFVLGVAVCSAFAGALLSLVLV